MPPELRQQLERAAEINGRSLNAEINARLISTLEEGARPHQIPHAVAEPPPSYALNKPEQEMLTIFRNWPAPRQLGFLSLFE